MQFRIAPHMLVIGWLAILICVWTSGDQVIDLVFEEPDVVADTTADEPDNAAEHVLMPSQRAGSSAPDAVMATPDLDAFSVAVELTDNTALRAAISHHRPHPTRPVSCSIPLRI